jgi:hypothetical protein
MTLAISLAAVIPFGFISAVGSWGLLASVSPTTLAWAAFLALAAAVVALRTCHNARATGTMSQLIHETDTSWNGPIRSKMRP